MEIKHAGFSILEGVNSSLFLLIIEAGAPICPLANTGVVLLMTSKLQVVYSLSISLSKLFIFLSLTKSSEQIFLFLIGDLTNTNEVQESITSTPQFLNGNVYISVIDSVYVCVVSAFYIRWWICALIGGWMQQQLVPPWLEKLLSTDFFSVCRTHGDAARSERNMFCLDCNDEAFCFYCRSSRHKEHKVIQVSSCSICFCNSICFFTHELLNLSCFQCSITFNSYLPFSPLQSLSHYSVHDHMMRFVWFENFLLRWIMNIYKECADKEIIIPWCCESFRDWKGVGDRWCSNICDQQCESFISKRETTTKIIIIIRKRGFSHLRSLWEEPFGHFSFLFAWL